VAVAEAAVRGANANVGKTPLMMAMVGGRGAPFGGGPGFNRTGPPPFREASERAPIEAVKTLLAAGADPNVKGAGRSDSAASGRAGAASADHPCARGRRCEARCGEQGQSHAAPAREKRRATVAANAAVMDQDAYRAAQNTKEEVIAALRELMKLGPTDPAPVPPPLRSRRRRRTRKRKKGRTDAKGLSRPRRSSGLARPSSSRLQSTAPASRPVARARRHKPRRRRRRLPAMREVLARG
jgi:hypothetical protein